MKLSIVVPCYNEEAVLPETTRQLGLLLDALGASGRISPDSEVVFVDDGSRDATWSLIEAAGALVHTFRACGLPRPRVRYRLFFPRALRALRPLERWLTACPLGAQYLIYGVVDAR